MRHHVFSTFNLIAILLGAATAQAGTLSSATWITELQGWGQGNVPASVPIGATGTSTATAVAVSLTVPPFSTQILTSGTGPGGPTPFPIFLTLMIGGAQSLTATGSMAAATMGVPGRQTIRTANHTSAMHTIGSMLTGGSMLEPGLVFASWPLNVGASGKFTGYFYGGIGNLHYLTVDFYGWTPHTRTFTGLTSMSEALPDVVAKGSFNLTPMGGGTVLLVSPTKVSIDGVFTQRRAVSLTTLKLAFVTEPGTLLLLGAAALALALRSRS